MRRHRTARLQPAQGVFARVRGTFCGRPITIDLSARQSMLLEQAHRTGYLIAPRRFISPLWQAWWSRCEAQDLPCVVATLDGRFSRVAVDMFTTGYDLDRVANQAIVPVFRRIAARWTCGPGRAWTEVPEETAESLARYLLQTALRCRQHYPTHLLAQRRA